MKKSDSGEALLRIMSGLGLIILFLGVTAITALYFLDLANAQFSPDESARAGNNREINRELENNPDEFREKQKKYYLEEKSILDTQQRIQEEQERKKLAAIEAARKAREDALKKKEAVLKGVPSIGNIGHCANAWWVNSQSSLRRLVEVCRALYLQATPAAQALGVPDFRLRTCTTQLWYTQHKKLLNLWCIMYHPGCTRWPYEREAWQTCKDGEYSRLRGW